MRRNDLEVLGRLPPQPPPSRWDLYAMSGGGGAYDLLECALTRILHLRKTRRHRIKIHDEITIMRAFSLVPLVQRARAIINFDCGPCTYRKRRRFPRARRSIKPKRALQVAFISAGRPAKHLSLFLRSAATNIRIALAC